MKKLLLLFMLVVLPISADNTLLISGFSKHDNKTDRYGEEFKSTHLGLGYRYNTGNHSSNTMIMNDSYGNLMYTTTYGYSYYLVDNKNWGLSVSAEFGVTVKKIKVTYAHTDPYISYFVYRLMPIALIPTATLKYKRFSINVTYVPHIEYSNVIIDEVTYLNFGIDF